MKTFLDNEEIRKKALELYESKKDDISYDENYDLRRIIEELNIHQIELEIQNEELQNAQLELANVLENYSDLYDFAPVGYLTLDRKSIIKNINLTASAIFEVERSYLYDRPITSHIHPEDRGMLHSFIHDVIDKMENHEVQVRVLKNNSDSIWTRWISRSEKRNGGEAVAKIAVIDIDKQRKLETELRKNNQALEAANRNLDSAQKKLNLALTATNLAWWEWDYLTGVVTFSKTKLEMLGYEPTENTMNVSQWIEKIHPDDYDSAMDSMRNHLEGKEKYYSTTYRMQTKEGKWKWFYDKGRIVQSDEKGKPLKVTGTVQDITDRIVTEQEKERLFNYSHDMFAVIRFDGSIISANPAWTRTLGWKRVELEGESILDFIKKQDRSLVEEKIHEMESTRNPMIGIAIRMLRKTEGSRWISFNAIVLPEEENIFLIGRDNTEIKEKEKEIEEYQADLEKKVEQRTRELHEANAAKNRFLSIIGHDLRGPISGLFSMIKLLVEEKLDESFKEKALLELLDSTRVTYDLLENLLLWSRTQEAKIDHDPRSVAIKDIIENIESLYKSNFQKKNISLTKEVDDRCFIFVDENMIMTIFRNLISNALKFTPAGGKIDVKAENIDNKAVICVQDNGKGIPEDKLINIFRIDKTFTSLGTANEKGSGLGLILVKEYIEMNNGSIDIKSEEGKGTVITMRFPLADQ